MTDKRSSVAIVVSHPIQHFCPLYRALSEYDSLRPHVLFASAAGYQEYYDRGFGRTIRWQENLLEGFDYSFLPGSELVRELAGPIANPHLHQVLDELRPDAVQVYGIHHPISRSTIQWARRHRKGVLYISDSELRSSRKTLARLRKRLVLPHMLRRIDSFLTVGDSNEAYYRLYGARQDQLFRSPFPIDEPLYREAWSKRERLRREVRRQLQISSDAVVLLTVGKLSPRKCTHHVIEALKLLEARTTLGHPELTLVHVGDGSEAEAIRRQAQALAKVSVKLPGFVSSSELPAWYLASDILVHPSSQDPHPLAITEAIYCGLPIVASDRVGSVGPTDDVRIGNNGLEYPFGNTAALATSLELLIADDDLRRTMSQASITIASSRNLSLSVQGYASGAQYAIQLRSSRRR